jgi:hypothetical protein
VFNNVGFCPGTTIEINLRTDTIEVLPDESEEHDCRLGRKLPRARPEYWWPKLERQRDFVTLECLAALGWRALVVWECELLSMAPERLARRLSAFLDDC